MIIAALFAIIFAIGASAKQVRVIGEPGNGEKIPIEISVKNGSMVTVSGQPNPRQSFFLQSINLYDFEKQLEARKVVDEDVCYIKIFKASYPQVKKVLAVANAAKVASLVSEEWNIPGDEIKADTLEKTVGPKIAEFCSGYKVFWLKENKTVKAPRRVKRWWLGRPRVSVSGQASANLYGGGLSASAGIRGTVSWG